MKEICTAIKHFMNKWVASVCCNHTVFSLFRQEIKKAAALGTPPFAAAYR
jgi:hypothetical protein